MHIHIFIFGQGKCTPVRQCNTPTKVTYIHSLKKYSNTHVGLVNHEYCKKDDKTTKTDTHR